MKLLVTRQMWAGSPVVFNAKDGKRIEATKLDEARTYAERNGYDGIRISYSNPKKKRRIVRCATSTSITTSSPASVPES